MFVNKINSVSNVGFKGYQHVKNNVGETIMKFYYPYDYENEDCEIQIYKVYPTDKFNYKVVENPIAKFNLKPDGVDIDLQSITNLDRDEAFAYNIVRKDKKTGNVIWKGADTGLKMKEQNGEFVFRSDGDRHVEEVKDKDGKVIGYREVFNDPESEYKYNLVSRRGTTPMVQGSGYLIAPDSFMPGAMYRGFHDENTGEIYYDKDVQKKKEGIIKSFSNILGGNIAGAQKAIPYLKKNGYTYIFSNPMANGSGGWSLGYWNKNNMQVSPNMGNIDNFGSYFEDLYKNGMIYVYDATLTSEGLEGVHFQYALRWAQNNPQTYYWFRMNGLKNTNLGLGVVPENAKDLRHRLVNAPYKYELQSNGTYKAIANDNYNSSKPTLVQIYDASQVTADQVNKLDKAIVNYENISSGNELDKITHDDTIINYTCQIDPKEYQRRIDVINDLNKKQGKNVKLDTPDGTVMAVQFSNFKIDKKTEGGFVTWDANTDMVKMNYGISGYDEKLLQAIPDSSEREYERKLMERGATEVKDMGIQMGVYWSQFVKDTQTTYTARTIGNAKTAEAINKLISEGKLPSLPKYNEIDDTVINNILNGQYLLKPKGVLDKDSVTVKSLMQLPLDTLEVADNTVGVLSTSYFSNRATKEEQLGRSRFDLMRDKNPHLVEPYIQTYQKVNSLYTNEIKNFADSIIKKLNENSNEKLLDKNGEYTEYGEYIMELIGKDIAKYALLKSLAGESFKTKVLPNGVITYDYDNIRANTNLEDLKIKAHNPKDEAAQLEKKIEKGLKTLGTSDIDFISDAMAKRFAGTDTMSFRVAEAFVDRAARGLAWRLDAQKDKMDQDAIRNEENSFDDIQTDSIMYEQQWVKGVKSINPHAYIVAEVTDIGFLMQDNYGLDSAFWTDSYKGQKFTSEQDFMAKLFNETGMTSEAAYSYFYTNLLQVFSGNFEDGWGESMNHDSFLPRLALLLETKNLDYLRNLYTFLGNHDKPRMIHGLATDMKLFHSTLLNDCKDFGNRRDQRLKVIQTLSGAPTMADVPIELRLNADNNDYFRTISARAVAQSRLLMGSVFEDLNGIASDADKRLIINALIDLANGNYLGEGSTDKLTKIKIKELSSLEEAFSAILKMAESHGLKLTETEKNELIKQVASSANSMNLANYYVHGDFNWDALPDNEKTNNLNHARDILGASFDASKHSLYTIQLAKLLKDAYLETGANVSAKEAIEAGIKDFAQKYDKQTIEANRDEFKKIEDNRYAMMKNGYAARDIRTAMIMAIKQAEFASGKTIANKEAIIDTVYKSVSEPAIQKASMIMEFLKGLFGIPTMYAGDELGMTGYDEKAKNIYLQNRNALPWSQIEENNLIGNYRKSVMESMNGALKDRSNPELHALNDGTPYLLDVQADGRSRAAVCKRLEEINKELNDIGDTNPKLKESLEAEQRIMTKNLAKIAYMMRSSNGDMTISIFNAGGIKHANRVDYFKEYSLDTEEKRKKFFEENNIESINPNNKYVPIQPKSEMDAILIGAGIAVPVGTVFTNANARDKAKYVVKKIGNNLGIVREDGGKIVMDGLTSKNGVMILKHIKNIIFKGAPKKKVYYNAQYNFVSNPYKAKDDVVSGEKLSIVAR